MLLGVWKSVQELEESLTLEELQAVIRAGRDREMRNWEFMASLKGIDIREGDDSMSAESRFEEVKRRAESKLTGRSSEEIELDAFGVDIIVED